MGKNSKIKSAMVLLVSMALPAMLAIYFYREIIDPRDVLWLAREGDSFQHYIGWHFFRREEWGWPLGAFSTLASDVPTSIVYTDSIPLIAIPLKLLHTWIPDPFQYLSLVMLVNYALNGLFAGRLLLRLGLPSIVVPLCAFLMASLPAVTMRGLGASGHEALTAHWIVFIALEYSLLQKSFNVRAGMSWLALLLVAVLMHFYLFFMAGVLWFFSMVNVLRLEKPWLLIGEGDWQCAIKWLAIALGTPVIVLFVMWGVGYFQLGGQGAGSGGYGYFSAEILTFLNPGTAWYSDGNPPSLSQLFGGWKPVHRGQYEGIAYLGAGFLLLLVVSASIFFISQRRHLFNDFCYGSFSWKCTWVACLCMFLFALSGEVGVANGNISLGYDELFGPLRQYLRSSGRLVWPLLYMVVVSLFFWLSIWMRPVRLMMLLLLAVWVQKEDLSPWHESLRETIQYRAEKALSEPVAYDVWADESVQEAWESHRHIVAFPPKNYDVLRPYMWIAAEHDMSINVAYLARISDTLVEEVTQPHMEALEAGRLSTDNVYLLSDPSHVDMVCGNDGWKCRTHDDITTAWSTADE